MLVGCPAVLVSPPYCGESHAHNGQVLIGSTRRWTYVEKHRLYNLALSIWEGRENYKV
jgi:hypothetical protein